MNFLNRTTAYLRKFQSQETSDVNTDTFKGSQTFRFLQAEFQYTMIQWKITLFFQNLSNEMYKLKKKYLDEKSFSKYTFLRNKSNTTKIFLRYNFIVLRT